MKEPIPGVPEQPDPDIPMPADRVTDTISAGVEPQESDKAIIRQVAEITARERNERLKTIQEAVNRGEMSEEEALKQLAILGKAERSAKEGQKNDQVVGPDQRGTGQYEDRPDGKPAGAGKGAGGRGEQKARDIKDHPAGVSPATLPTAKAMVMRLEDRRNILGMKYYGAIALRNLYRRLKPWVWDFTIGKVVSAIGKVVSTTTDFIGKSYAEGVRLQEERKKGKTAKASVATDNNQVKPAQAQAEDSADRETGKSREYIIILGLPVDREAALAKVTEAGVTVTKESKTGQVLAELQVKDAAAWVNDENTLAIIAGVIDLVQERASLSADELRLYRQQSIYDVLVERWKLAHPDTPTVDKDGKQTAEFAKFLNGNPALGGEEALKIDGRITAEYARRYPPKPDEKSTVSEIAQQSAPEAKAGDLTEQALKEIRSLGVEINGTEEPNDLRERINSVITEHNKKEGSVYIPLWGSDQETFIKLLAAIDLVKKQNAAIVTQSTAQQKT